MSAAGYQSWFVSARDPRSPRALWIRRTVLRPREGQETTALWCTVVDREQSERPVAVKQVFAAPPADASAGPAKFLGRARMGQRSAGWDLAITPRDVPLRPLRPGW